MRKLAILLSFLIVLPLAVAFDNDDLPSIYGWNWNTFQEVDGNWRVIGNQTMLTTFQFRRQEALIRIDAGIPQNLTELSISFELLAEDHTSNNNITLSNYFYLEEYGPNQVIFLVGYTTRQIGNWYWSGRERWYDIRLWLPSTGAWVQVLDLYVGGNVMDRFTFAYKLMADGNYRVEVYAELLRQKLLPSDLFDPADHLLMETRSAAFGTYTYRYYRLYSGIEIVTAPFHSPANVTWKFSKNAPTHEGADCNSRILMDDTYFINATYTVGDDTIIRDQAERINLMERLVNGAGRAFNALRLPAVGNFLISISSTVGTMTDTVMFTLPVIFGMISIFIFAIMMKGMFTGNFSLITDFFFNIYHVLASIIGKVLGLFWGIMGAISSAPFGNIIIAIGFLSVLVYIGISI